MKQLTLAAVGFERYAKTTRRAAFLAEMERVVPWSALCALIEPFYPKPGNGRPPIGSSGCCASISCSSGSICRTQRQRKCLDELVHEITAGKDSKPATID